ncbi:uncharacterized protein LOC144340010 isoform X2 [Macaca mulatta]
MAAKQTGHTLVASPVRESRNSSVSLLPQASATTEEKSDRQWQKATAKKHHQEPASCSGVNAEPPPRGFRCSTSSEKPLCFQETQCCLSRTKLPRLKYLMLFTGRRSRNPPLICRPPGTELNRTEEKYFLPDTEQLEAAVK